MSQAQKTDQAVPIKNGGSVAPDLAEQVKQGVVAYWRELGVNDPALIERLAEECLQRAGRRVGQKVVDEELLRRALEEAQRRFDHALGRALRLPPSADPQPIAAARAAFLLNKDKVSADSLFEGETPPDLVTQLQAVLPQSTPPEAPQTMDETPLRFWLFKSTHPHR